MEMNGHLLTPTSLLLEENPQISNEWEASWDPQLVWTLWNREKNILSLLTWFFSPYLSRQNVEVVEKELRQTEAFTVMTPCNSVGFKTLLWRRWRRKILPQMHGDITDKAAVWKLQISTRYLNLF
jgi:hypothetical protein